jgi:hypothetical protein
MKEFFSYSKLREHSHFVGQKLQHIDLKMIDKNE